MAINNLEQQRLLYAMRATSKDGRARKELSNKERSSNYDSMVKKVPAYVQKNGFVYTMAFLNEKDHEVFYDIWKWHCSTDLNTRKLAEKEKGEFLKYLLELEDASMLRALTLETLAIMKCFKRFVKDED
ncbi:MAG: type III-B CRISPR module-associated protein Cmr5 [Bacteroidota bacterium]